MFIRCFSDSVYEAEQWPAVLQLENMVFAMLSVYLEELRSLHESDLLEQIRTKLAEMGFPPDEVASIATKSFIADFLRKNMGAISTFLSGLPQGHCIPVEICVACQRDDVLMRCLEESPEFAHFVQAPGYRAWMEEKEQEIESRLKHE